MQPGHHGLRGAKRDMEDAHKSEIQGHLATFEKLQHAEQDVIR
jgi:hypothetical protein